MPDISRRALLSCAGLGAAVGIGAGLGFARPVHHKVAVPPPAPPAALTEALAGQQVLLAGYDRVAGAPAALKADVTAHGDALRALLERYPGWRLNPRITSTALPTSSSSGSAGSGSGAAVPASTAELAAASTALARTLTAAVLSWPAGESEALPVVPTLASISAALSTHAAVLA